MDNIFKSELYVFLITMYGGIIIGFIYDLYRVFRYFSKPKRVATFLEDLVFWIIVTIITLGTLLYSNYGELRGYVFLGFIVGAIIYYFLLSNLVVKTIIYIIKLITKIIKYILSIIISPLMLIIKVIKKYLIKVSEKIGVKYRKSKRILKIPSRIVYDIRKHTKSILFKKR